MCGRYALALAPRAIRRQLIQNGMRVDEYPEEEDVAGDEGNEGDNNGGDEQEGAGAGSGNEEEIEDGGRRDHNNSRSNNRSKSSKITRQSYNIAPGYIEPVYRAVSLSTATGGESGEEGDTQVGGGEGKGEDGDGVKYMLQPMKWGLIPFWTKRNPDYGSMMKTINCRDDSLLEDKGMWTSMKKTKRCIVLAEGFFEWLKKGKDKVPHYIKRADGKLLCLAGLWDSVSYSDSDPEAPPLYTYTIITTTANKSMSFLHDRMPVILDPGSEAIRKWLDPSTKTWTRELQEILRPYDEKQTKLVIYPVKKEVGKVGNDGRMLIVPLDSEENRGNIKNWFGGGGGKKGAVKNEKEIKDELKEEDDEVRIKEGKGENEKYNIKHEDNTDGIQIKKEEEAQTEHNAPLSSHPPSPLPKKREREETPSSPQYLKTTTPQKKFRSATSNEPHPNRRMGKSPAKGSVASAVKGNAKITSFFK